MPNPLQKISETFAQLRASEAVRAPNQFAEEALERHKAQGMRLAFAARIIALVVIAILLPILNPQPAQLYYVAFTPVFALIGWAQLKLATVGRNRVEFLLLVLDLVVLTILITVPNPFDDFDAPLEAIYRFSGHTYFYIYLALATLAFSWRTVRGFAMFGAIIWMTGVGFVWWLANDHPGTALVTNAMADYPFMLRLLQPDDIRFDLRFQEVVLFGIVAFILSITVKRFNDLLFDHAAMERERTNLARYFSPNMVEEFSNNDEPLTQIKTQNVAVLFVDIIGFTTYANARDADEVITSLREFHGLMEKCVFDNHGTLDKFLGDGLMATFGTPFEGENDAQNCYACAQAMVTSVDQWNRERKANGREPLKIGIGIHYGPCVLGDIGGENRLEFAVIGDTVNLASRVEAKTRELKVDIAMTKALSNKLNGSLEASKEKAFSVKEYDNQQIRGITEPITLIGVNAE